MNDELPPPENKPALKGGQSRRLQKFTLALLCAFYLVVTAAPLLLVNQERHLQEAVKEHVAGDDRWTVYKIEVEYARILNALYRAQADASRADAGAADRKQVELAFDILYSRNDILKSPDIARKVGHLREYPKTVATIDAMIKAADEIFRRDKGATLAPESITALLDVVRPVEITINALSLETLTSSTQERNSIRARAEAQSSNMTLAIGALVAASLIYFAGLGWSNRQLVKSSRRIAAAEAAIREAATRLRLVTNNLPMVIAYIDQDGLLQFVNKTGEQWYSRPAAQLLGKRLDDLHGAQDAAKLAPLGDRVLTGAVVETKTNLTCPDGLVRAIEITLIPDRAEDGGVRGAFVVMSDVTRRDEIEARFIEAQKMEAIGRLTGGVAHDFNNLLGVILSNLELLIARVTSRDDRQMLDDVMSAAMRGVKLTRQLLSFSRQQPLSPKSTATNAVVTKFAGMVKPMLGDPIKVDLSLSPAAWPAMVDVAQLETAMLNLCVNARDAMPNGGRLLIETDNLAVEAGAPDVPKDLAPGNYVRISVADSGTGMAPAVAAKAFEPFFTTKDIGQGSGLGLSMVYGFVKQSGGDVAIESMLNHGTRVTLFVPTAPLPDSIEKGASKRSSPSRGGSEVILVVEDNDQLRRAVVCQLRGLGYRTIEADSGQAALEQLMGPQVIDLVFTDVMMPGGISGYDLAREASKLRPGIKILLTSGHHGALNAASSADMPEGVNILQKPYRQDELARAVASCLTPISIH